MVTPGDVDRLFLQAVLSRGIMSIELAQLLWGKCIKAVNDSDSTLKIPHRQDRQSWEAFISKINDSLDKLELEFRTLRDETTAYLFKSSVFQVNLKGDEVAQLATDYTPPEITFFKAIVEQIMLAPNESFVISDMAALREPSAIGLTTVTKIQAEIILASFVQKGWLLKSRAGRYTLSTRSLIELQPYLKSHYPDEILECTICMEILTRGVACHTANCKARLHFHCFTTYRRRHGGCPSCSAPWPANARDHPLVPVGEGAYSGLNNQRRTRTTTPSEGDENEELEELEEPTQNAAPAEGASKQPVEIKKERRGADMDVGGEEDVPTQPTQRRRSGRH
uniref:Non-structural maintenance of chromosomes element 1 homolog n=1 Tax=Psilocybe cubensis TaxID=181762 RepID=A0A8H7Y5N4_PSICU